MVLCVVVLMGLFVLLEVVFKPPKQKSQISLVFGMNALVPLGTIKTLSKTNLDFLYTP